jgi:hypothetical protein
MDIVDGVQTHPQDLILTVEMVHISFAVIPAGVTIAFVIQGSKVVLVLLILDIDLSVPGINGTIPCIPGRQNAVHHIDTAGNGVKYIFRFSHSHQVAGLF